MTNPAFDAAMLLRGLRAMDAALGETYNVTSHTCIPAPVVYSSEFPAAGLNFSQYQRGSEDLTQIWRTWMYDDGGKGKLKASVHEDVEATVVEAFDILSRCDKSKDGLLTKSEWETCQTGRSAKDQLWDLEYLQAFYNVSGKMLTLEKNEPLNPANPDSYPELISARSEMQKKDVSITSLKSDLRLSREETDLYQKVSIGTGLAVVALTAGLIYALRARKRHQPTSNEPKADAKPAAPAPSKKEKKSPKAVEQAAAPATSDGYGDILSEINPNSAGAPSKELLEALGEEAPAAEPKNEAALAPLDPTTAKS